MLTKQYKTIQTNTINQDQSLFLNEPIYYSVHVVHLLHSREERSYIHSRFLGIDEANNFANLLRAILPKHGFIISEPYPIVRDSLEKEFHDCCESSTDLLGRLDELT